MGNGALQQIRAAWLRYIILLAGLMAVVAATIVLMWPQPLERLVEEYLFPEPIPTWSSPPSPEELRGCYALSLSEWLPRADLGGDMVFTSPPREIQLTTEPWRFAEGDEYYVIKPVDDAAATGHRLSSWHVSPEGTLRMGFSTGFSGVSMELGPADSELAGRARTFWDFPRLSQWAVARAKRIACPGAPESDEAVEQDAAPAE